MKDLKPNRLLAEASPYLLQHANNPVDWYPWSEEALATAAKENKLLIISIGYSACHWCHVMEKETFEDAEAAELMNQHFISIKIDREERPDLDQVYMQAVQMLWGQGGWPLNVFALPDGRPFYGGTYFRKEQWKDTINQIIEIKNSRPQEIEKQAQEIMDGLLHEDILSKRHIINVMQKFNTALTAWLPHFDMKEGGMKGAPKFPLPVQHEFLLRYYYHTHLTDVKDFVLLSLKKMAKGGIYDQLGGGFARYSTDSQWKVPHFEKMLYDNAQLIGLYIQAWQLTRDDLFKRIVEETIEFIINDLCSEEGGFYSALDADSEGEEGKYYVWTEEEIDTLLSIDSELFKRIYGIGEEGYWEDKKNILIGVSEPQTTEESLSLERSRKILLQHRKKRVAPGLDDKILTSWNAMMNTALIQAAKVFQREDWLLKATVNLELLFTKVRRPDGRLLHRYKNGNAGIPAFLEDYAFLIEACITFPTEKEEKYLHLAKDLCDIAIEDFYDKESSLFYFSSNEDKSLIARKKETGDNVIPSSNSVMARNVFKLGLLFERPDYLDIARSMLNAVGERIERYLPSHSHWGIAGLEQHLPYYSLVISGKETDSAFKELYQHYLPNVILIKAQSVSRIPIVQAYLSEGDCAFHLCTTTECLAAVRSLEEVLSLINK